ncbi:transposase [uncultured Oscillibacter sp.]|uniref:transposase n=1 Tax=uncultured Oscillibacter sp. TaxID=876091 RepID=UPI003451EE5F
MIYWGDETGIDNCSNCKRGFAPKGQPPVLPVETKRKRLNMLSALSRQGDVHFYYCSVVIIRRNSRCWVLTPAITR